MLWDALDFAKQIVCLLRNLMNLIIAGMTAVVNLVFDAIGLLLKLVMLVMPDMPGLPATVVSNDILSGLNWFFPVGAFLAFVTLVLGVYIAFLVIRIAARWVKYL